MKRLLLLLIAALLVFSACARKENKTPTESESSTEPIEPATEPTLDQTNYSAFLTGVFDTVLPNDEADFTFTVSGETAAVISYTGGGGRIRVPDTLGGATVTAIGDSVFAGRDDLDVLILPDTVAEFGEGILQGTKLTALKTPLPMAEEAAFLGYFWGVSDYRDNALPILRSLKYLEIRQIGQTDAAFVLRHHAFYDCVGLIAVRLPQTTAKVEERAFFGCENLRYVNTEGIREIGEYAFCGCSALQTLSFGSELSKIGFSALRDCNGLIELTLPFVGGSQTENTYLGYLFGAATPAFSEKFYSPYLRKVTLSAGCTGLPDFALFECRSLRTLILPETLTAVGARALSGCSALTKLSLPTACKTIGDAACAGCTALETVSFGENVSVGTNAFLGCSKAVFGK